MEQLQKSKAFELAEAIGVEVYNELYNISSIKYVNASPWVSEAEFLKIVKEITSESQKPCPGCKICRLLNKAIAAAERRQ